MGKASLLFVAAFSVAGATVLFSSQRADVDSAASQGAYQADVVAREIARSAYNAGTADINRHGNDIDAALAAFGAPAADCANGKAACFRRTGRMLGGTYLVEASPNGGNGIDVFSQGTYGYDAGGRRVEKTHRINETYSVGVLEVDPSGGGGRLRIQFVDSEAGYCSAIFVQRTIPGLPPEAQPLPQMVYPSGKKRNGDRNEGYEIRLEPGTQMNFAIGVENTRNQNYKCDGVSSRGALPLALRPKDAKSAAPADTSAAARQAFRDLLAGYVFDENHFDWVHWALDGSALRDGDPKEGPWAMVEVDPSNNQRWRIAFEDIHDWDLGPDHADYHNPGKSLWATKEYGYDWSGSFRTVASDGKGDGWTDVVRTVITPNPGSKWGYTVSYVGGQDGFHDLRDHGSTPDFSDQVIIVEVVPDPDV